MTERLLTPDDIMVLLSCGRDKALILMRSMRHINISAGKARECLRVTESDFNLWLRERTRQALPERKPGRKSKSSSHKIPYRHETA